MAKLSWQNWDPRAWEDVWNYQRHFALPEEFRGSRVFLHFAGVMVGATPVINGHELPRHSGGYLPFRYEVTDWLRKGENVLAMTVDSRWSNVPPEGAPGGAARIDYLEPGGIHRGARLEAAPSIFLSDVVAKPAHVLEETRRVEVVCTLDAARTTTGPLEVHVELKDGAQVVSRASETLRIEKEGQAQVQLTLSNLGNIVLWDLDTPQLYDVVTTLSVRGKPVHDHRVRIGLREARFELDGFFLNGHRLQLFGLNRHELYPYVGGAMAPRVLRRDAEIICREFNCNIVRCSHYPQSEAFLDACDELGLLVWEEVPGWGYVGDEAWKELLIQDTKDMVVRDRNHPSIVVWGVRVNESANDVELYRRTTAVAKSLDDSRPASGSMTPGSRKTWQQDWHEDVFAFDDYHSAPDGSVGIAEPVPDVPYMLAEAVGQFNYRSGKGFDNRYRRAGEVKLQEQQAIWHAQAHSKAAANPRICGVIAWCGFDYASLINAHNAVKCPGVADVFRIPKLGASFYQAQCDPEVRPVIQPNFYWDFGAQTPRGPGAKAAVFSNCERLEVFLDGRPHSTLYPDVANFPHLRHPPFFADLEVDGAAHSELRIDGYAEERLLVSRSFSSDPNQDQLFLEADDTELIGDGAEATRLVFKVVDKYGAERAFAGGEVAFELRGPGVIVGDNPFSLAESGGVGALWVKTLPGSFGRIRVEARHSRLGRKAVEIEVIRL
ncbi:MAG TPA: glycoside hydrolase family 2 TIM barrel-domain containing protein [Candidatus Dormibacteraeota bacterium]|nr:glycoside hydrolase family 2 TIM barrel-domain containing protein [Candidatus Dormibacteraeota bacterium]